jgi:hypothetical protein
MALKTRSIPSRIAYLTLALLALMLLLSFLAHWHL